MRLRTGRLQVAAARLLAHLPDGLKIMLSGEPPVIVDGQRLDPQLQLLRGLRRRRATPGLLEPTIAAGRTRFCRDTQAFRGGVTRVGAVRDFEVPGPAGSIRVRHYAPGGETRQRAAPLLVYLHGGGFVMGDLDTHDEPCRILCRAAGAHVLSVHYRLAPEHPFPAAIEDACAAFRWAHAHAAALGADAASVSVGGDSAGGTLAGVVSLLADDDWRPCSQLLIYPATDAGTRRNSHRLFADGFALTRRDSRAFLRHYIDGTGTLPTDPRVSPLLGENLRCMPPTMIAVAGFDILRDEGDALATSLRDAGVAVDALRFSGLEHGFIHLTGLCPAARQALVRTARAWRALADTAAAAAAAGRHAS